MEDDEEFRSHIRVERRERQQQGNTIKRGGIGRKKWTFGFPILDIARFLSDEVKMKNITPSVLPYFYEMVTKDPNAFLFEFDISCHIDG